MDKTLNKEMTDLAMTYIADGYVINGRTMSGSDGTERLDLIKGKNFIRIWKERVPLTRSKDGFYGDAVLLIVGEAHLNHPNVDIVWKDDLSIVLQKKYYVIGDYYSNYILTDNVEQCKKCREITANRISYYDDSNCPRKKYTDYQRLAIGFKAVKKQPRTKSVHLEDMVSVERRGKCYYACYRTKNGTRYVQIG